MRQSKANSLFLSACIFFIAIITKIIQYTLLPAKYFFDSNKILAQMNGYLVFDFQDAFAITAIFSRYINIFHLDSLLQWSIFYTTVFTIIIIILINRFKVDTLIGFIWILASVGVVSLYSLNLSKDVFQFTAFLLLYTVLSSKLSSIQKNVLSIGILFLWGNLFRSYFVLIAIYTMLSYLIVLYFKQYKINSFMLFFVMLISMVFFSLVFASIVMPDEYNTIVYTHHRLTVNRAAAENTMTLIKDVFALSSRANIFVYMINYIINLIRMMFPFELLIKLNLSYLLFLAYQTTITVLFIRRLSLIFLKEFPSEQILAFSIYIGFLLGSALFEPDFGSWIRHESTIFPVLMILFYETKGFAVKKVYRTTSRYLYNYHIQSP